ncbi:MAG TPA: alpha-E domain-containing protein [Polyangiaceae bacterium]|nr:alpha-E domain-containing protein [Polyangiaceae bacterium]
MLSRVAEALYWMGRYLERAEHAARVLEAMRDVRLDLAEVDRDVADAQWHGALRALAMPDLPLGRLILDPAEATSLLCSVSRARENARQVREVISPQMWEELNQRYWALRDAVGSRPNEDMLSQALTSIVSSCYLWDGVTDASMIRGEGWLYLKLGKFVERTDGIARLLAVRLEDHANREASRSQEAGDSSGDNVEWLALIKSFDALDAYRKAHPKRVDQTAVVTFMLFEVDFPRALRFSTNTAADLSRRLLRLHPESGRAVERHFGRLAARVEYAEPATLEGTGSVRFLREVSADVNEASGHLQKTFFLS